MDLKTIQFKTKMLGVVNKLKQEDIESIKYFFLDHFGEGVLESITTATALLAFLERKEYYDASNLQSLIELLNAIGRSDISEILTGDHQHGRSDDSDMAAVRKRIQQSISTSSVFDVRLVDYIAKEIGSEWQRLVRHLNLDESAIDHIDNDYRKTHQKAVAALNSCLYKSDKPLTWTDVKRALNNIQRNDVIFHVNQHFSHLIDVHPNPSTSAIQESGIDLNNTHEEIHPLYVKRVELNEKQGMEDKLGKEMENLKLKEEDKRELRIEDDERSRGVEQNRLSGSPRYQYSTAGHPSLSSNENVS